MTYIGALMIYYGDEVGLTGGKDPDCRKMMIWDEEKQDRRLLATMKSLISLRQRYQLLRRGPFARCWLMSGLFGFLREHANQHARVLVLLNNGTEDQRIALENIPTLQSGVWTSVFHTAPTRSSVASHIGGRFNLPKTSGMVLLQGELL
ncbi:MAG: hypothetical protein C4326_10480 [Ignavibacteria bacterium]